MVQIANAVMTKKKIAITMNDARQPHILVAIPDDMLPRMKPNGFPAPKAPAALFLLFPSGKVANNVPIAGGEMIAVPNPRKPHRTSIATALGAKAVRSEKNPRQVMPQRS